MDLLWQHARQDRAAWSGTDHVIENWLKERQRLLVMYNDICMRLASMQFYNEPKRVNLLKLFCQLLTDYVSKGDFEIFEKIDDAEKSCGNFDKLDTQVLVNIFKTTLIALDFSDKYSKTQHLDDLADDLAELGIKIFDGRLKCEDAVARHYLQVTNQQKSLTQDSPRARY